MLELKTFIRQPQWHGRPFVVRQIAYTRDTDILFFAEILQLIDPGPENQSPSIQCLSCRGSRDYLRKARQQTFNPLQESVRLVCQPGPALSQFQSFMVTNESGTLFARI